MSIRNTDSENVLDQSQNIGSVGFYLLIDNYYFFLKEMLFFLSNYWVFLVVIKNCFGNS